MVWLSRFIRVLTFTLVLILSCAAFFFISSWPLETFLVYKIEKTFPDVKVTRLTLGRHFLTKDKSFVIQDASAVARVKKAGDVQASLKELVIDDVSSLFKTDQASGLRVSGVNVRARDYQLVNGFASLNYQLFKEKFDIKGRVAIATAEIAGQQFNNTSFDLQASEREIRVKNLNSHLAPGGVKGEFDLAYDNNFSYSIDVEFDNVPAGYVALESFSLGQQVKGVLSGTLALKGDAKKIINVAARFDAPGGIYVNAKMLKPLLEYIPQSVQKEQIEKIIQEGKNIYLDRFKLDVVNSSVNALNTVFDLKSVEYNLDVNLGVDINVDGGLTALFTQGMNTIPKEKIK